MKYIRLSWFPILLLAATASAAEFKQVDAKKSTLNFVSKQMGVPVQGEFHHFSVTMNFDPQKLSTSKAQIIIDMNSIDAGSKEANEEVIGSSWFNVKKFPTATFISTQIKTLDKQHYQIVGNLTLKGKTLPVSAPFTFTLLQNTAVFKGALTIKRTDYGIGEGTWGDDSVVAKDVQIQFQIAARTE